MNKILCPIDFSNSSLNALEFAARIGEKHRSDLTLLFVFTEEELNVLLEKSEESVTYDNWKQKVENNFKGLIEEVKATSIKKGLADCKYLLKQGDLIRSIKEAVKEGGFNLIVMGTKGVSDITETYVGSNTVQVIEKSDCPVLCVPEKASYKKFKKIVYATDYQEEDKKAISQLLAFATPFKAHVNILHVSHSNKLFEKAVYEDYKNEILTYLNYKDLTFTIQIYEDEINNGIDEYMIQENAELLVLLTKEKTFFEKMFTKSLSESMSYFVDYPLLIYKVSD
jgi:nucleotide-binding universal stress UspA family protein